MSDEKSLSYVTGYIAGYMRVSMQDLARIVQEQKAWEAIRTERSR